jgi:hypothetical protein
MILTNVENIECLMLILTETLLNTPNELELFKCLMELEVQKLCSWFCCDITSESRNSGARARRPLMSND